MEIFSGLITGKTLVLKKALFKLQKVFIGKRSADAEDEAPSHPLEAGLLHGEAGRRLRLVQSHAGTR